MDYDKLIERLKVEGNITDCLTLEITDWEVLDEAATALSTLQAELEAVRAERDAAKSPEVIEAVDELVEFARTRMCTADWLYYANVLGEWRGQKED